MERAVQVKDAIALMAAMAAHRIGVLEMPGLKLVAGAPERSTTPSASNITAPVVRAPENSGAGIAQAAAAVQAARIEAARQAAVAQSLPPSADIARTARTNRRMAGGFTAGPSVGALVDDLHKESLRVAPRTKGGGGKT